MERRRESKPRKGCAEWGNSVIRQAISCDICATEKKQTNHWFVAYEQSGELRVSGWHSRNRLRPGSKHLCGQTCLHKLVDEFIAKAISMRSGTALAADAAEVKERTVGVDTSLTSSAAFVEPESTAQLIASAGPAPALPPPQKTHAELVTMPGRVHGEELLAPLDEPRFASQRWRVEAWVRERQRELRTVENRPDIAARRRSSA